MALSVAPKSERTAINSFCLSEEAASDLIVSYVEKRDYPILARMLDEYDELEEE